MNANKIIDFFFEIATLRRLTRSHRQVIENVSDNISDHCFRVAVIGMILAKLENADENKVLKICLFHDLAEARTGDANYVNKKYVKMNEEGALADQMKELPIKDEVIALFKEYEDRETLESFIAKDADVLDQMILQQEYFYNDKTNADKWHDNKMEMLKTKSARELSNKIREANPFNWVYEITD